MEKTKSVEVKEYLSYHKDRLNMAAFVRISGLTRPTFQKFLDGLIELKESKAIIMLAFIDELDRNATREKIALLSEFNTETKAVYVEGQVEPMFINDL